MSEFKTTHFIIIHGYTANPEAHWFDWLKNELERRGATVSIPQMPMPHAPRPEAWAEKMSSILPDINPHVFLIGHSLGCITLLRHLLTCDPLSKVGGYALVSGFDRPLTQIPKLSTFTAEPLDYGRLKAIAPIRISLFSDNDSIVEPELSQKLGEALDTWTIRVSGGGHFLDREGFSTFPELLHALCSNDEI